MNLLHWNKPLPRRGVLLADLKRYVESFLLQLAAGSVLLMERESKPGFLQLAILERRDQRLGVEFGLPDADWSHDQFDLVHELLETAASKLGFG